MLWSSVARFHFAETSLSSGTSEVPSSVLPAVAPPSSTIAAGDVDIGDRVDAVGDISARLEPIERRPGALFVENVLVIVDAVLAFLETVVAREHDVGCWRSGRSASARP